MINYNFDENDGKVFFLSEEKKEKKLSLNICSGKQRTRNRIKLNYVENRGCIATVVRHLRSSQGGRPLGVECK